MKQNSTPTTTQTAFDDVLHLIDSAKQRVYRAANTELIDLYWQVGELISKKIASAEWGDGVVAQLADFIAQTQPNLRGFTQRNLFRMRQFYEAYQGDTKVSPLVTQLSWTHNLTILSRSKRPEEREFYLKMAIQEKWSKRELERQFNTALFERVVLSPVKTSPIVAQHYPKALDVFKDSYVVEFLNLPSTHNEADLHKGLLLKLRDFLLELGRDFCFIGSEYALQVGKARLCLRLVVFSSDLKLFGCD
ncbi:MAG: PDDEXK nuclease domain-containing protein [Agitococcus sp.]